MITHVLKWRDTTHEKMKNRKKLEDKRGRKKNSVESKKINTRKTVTLKVRIEGKLGEDKL